MGALYPTPFGARQHCWGVGSGGAGNVGCTGRGLRVILETGRDLESEGGTAETARDTQRQNLVAGVRLGRVKP